MSRSIRKLVGGGAAALAIGIFFALIAAAQLAGAPSSSHLAATKTSAGPTSVVVNSGYLLKVGVDRNVLEPARTAGTPSSACTTARTNLAAATVQDKTEDSTERTNASAVINSKTTDVAEDKSENAASKPLVDAVGAACESTKPAPPPACTSSLRSLRAAFQAEQGEDAAEKAAGTEGTAGDATEDQAERSRMVPLWQVIRTNCVLDTHGAFSKVGSTKALGIQH